MILGSVTLCTQKIALAAEGFVTVQFTVPFAIGMLLKIVFEVFPLFRLIDTLAPPVTFAEVQLIGTVVPTTHTLDEVGSVTVIEAGALGAVVKVKSPLDAVLARLSAEVTL